MDTLKFEKVKKVINSIMIGDICRELPFQESAMKAYLDDIAADMPEVFADKETVLSLIRSVIPNRDIMANMAYGLAYCIPSSSDAQDAVSMFLERVCRCVDDIVVTYADVSLKNDKDILREVLERYCEKNAYLPQYYKEYNGFPDLCRSVSPEVLLDDEIMSRLLAIADPVVIYCELLADDQKKDKNIVWRLLEGYKDQRFMDYNGCFNLLCEYVPRELLMDEDVRDRFFEIGVPSVIYGDILTDGERQDDRIIGSLLQVYRSPLFRDPKSDFKKLKKLWAENIVENFRKNEYARMIIENNDPEAAEDFFCEIGESGCGSIDEDIRPWSDRMWQMDYDEYPELTERERALIEKGTIFWIPRPYQDSFESVIEPYRFLMMAFDDAADELSGRAAKKRAKSQSTAGADTDEFMCIPGGIDDQLPFS